MVKMLEQNTPTWESRAPWKFLLGHHVNVMGSVNRPLIKSEPIHYYLDDLTKSMTVLGNSGSGKTNTINQIIDGLNSYGVPVWIIECKKKEYRKRLLPQFKPSQGILHFTPEIEDLNPFRINPFEVANGVRVQTHAQNTVSVFNDAYQLYKQEPLPELLEDGIYLLYDDWGWDVTMNERPPGENVYPRLSDLPDAIEEAFERRKKGTRYKGDVRENMVSALNTRIKDLLHAGRGKMYDCERGIPIDLLYQFNVIWELDHMGDKGDERRKFFVGSLLTSLAEYIGTLGQQLGLRHVIIIEEAHRVLDSDSGRIGQQTGNVIINLISEQRASGEAIIVVDQHPERLPPHLIGLTQSCIVHKLQSVDATNRFCDSFSYRRNFMNFRELDPSKGEGYLVAPRKLKHGSDLKIEIPCHPCTKHVADVQDDEVRSSMQIFYEQFPEIRPQQEIKGPAQLLMGLRPREFDRICARLEFLTLINDFSRLNPFNLQNRTYSRAQCLKEFNDKKFNVEVFLTRITQIQKILKNSDHVPIEIFRRIMMIATHADRSPVPLSAVLYFLRRLVLHFDFSWKKRTSLYQQFLNLLKTHPDNEVIFSHRGNSKPH